MNKKNNRSMLGWLVGLMLCGAALVSAADESSVVAPPQPAPRVPKTQMDIAQLPNEKLDWLLDAKFGMFIHWGLYSGPATDE
jgi:alpha-L-fucosidase